MIKEKIVSYKNKKGKSFNHLNQYNLIDCIPHSVYLLNKNGFFSGANERFLRLIEFKHVGNLIGKNYKQIEKYFPWPRKCTNLFKHYDLEVLTSGIPMYGIETSISNEYNIYYYISHHIPLFNKRQKIIGLMVIITVPEHNKKASNPHLSLENVNPIKQPHILIVEDNIIAQRHIQSLLINIGCQVDLANSSKEVALLFKPGKYNLAFMDINLIDTSGYVVAKEIRNMEKGTKYKIPIIALTCYQAEVIKEDCLYYTMEGAISKPLTKKLAIQIIRNYIYSINTPIEGLNKEQTVIDGSIA